MGVFGSGSTCPSVGSPAVMVIPLYFTNTGDFSEEELANIELAYKGENLEDNAFYSLEKYYRLSSGGALDMNCQILDPVRINMTDSAWARQSSPIDDLIQDCISNLDNPEDFDYDGDKRIDAIHIIYKTTQTLDWGGFWWHYTTYTNVRGSNGYQGGTYFFSNYEDGMMNRAYGNYPDSHTIIHETGHALGLNDYYSYDNNDNDCPAGCVDMMDYNYGDHCAYSKMLLGWNTTPYVIDGTSDDFQITLKPYSTSGEFILLKGEGDDWNGTPWDEYITLSYYTVEGGVNDRDAEGYSQRGHAYRVDGLQAFHVDSRVYSVYSVTSSYLVSTGSYATEIEESMMGYYWGTAASNTPSQSIEFESQTEVSDASYYSDNRLLSAISADGRTNFAYNPGRDSILFGIGDTYSSSTGPSSFNEGYDLGYDFEVTSMNEEGITIHFTAI